MSAVKEFFMMILRCVKSLWDWMQEQERARKQYEWDNHEHRP